MKPSMDDRIKTLIDDWELIFIDLHDLCVESPGKVPSFVNFMIIEPLEKYIEKEYKKNEWSESCRSAVVLRCRARSAVNEIAGSTIDDKREYAWAIKDAWRQWHLDLSAEIKKRATPFLDAGKNRREDSLSEDMIKTFKEFCKKHGKQPTAKELWKAISIGPYIQEKVSDDMTIAYRKKNGKEETCPFNSFQNRFTRIKKIYKNKKK